MTCDHSMYLGRQSSYRLCLEPFFVFFSDMFHIDLALFSSSSKSESKLPSKKQFTVLGVTTSGQSVPSQCFTHLPDLPSDFKEICIVGSLVMPWLQRSEGSLDQIRIDGRYCCTAYKAVLHFHMFWWHIKLCLSLILCSKTIFKFCISPIS